MSLVVNPFIRSGVVPSERVILDRRRASRVFSPLIVEGGSLGVYGERGVGKSSLLNHIANPPADWREAYLQNHIFVSFNCDAVSPFTLASFWLQATRQLDRKIESGPIKEKCRALLARQEEGAELNAPDFHEILDVAAGSGQRIVLVLDDFDVLIRTGSDNLDTTRVFLQGLRSLTTRDSNKANLVVATRHSLEQLCKPVNVLGASPFSNGFTLYRLQLLRDTEMNWLLQWVEEAGQDAFSNNEADYIRFLSGFHPQLTQIAAAEIFDQRLERGAPLDDLTPVGERFRSEARRVFESLWEAASEVERMLLMVIALQKLEGKLPKREYSLRDLPVIFSERERELFELTDRGLVIWTRTDPPTWAIFSPIFEWWVLKEIESAGPEQLEDYRKVWGNLLTRRHANKLAQLVDLARENLDVIEAVGQAVIRMAGWTPPILG